MKRTLLIIILSFATHVFAGGDQVGNGGQIVVCRSSAGALLSAELLDVFEARTLRGFQLDLGDASLTVDQKVSYAITRLAKNNPSRAQRYEAWHSHFAEKIVWSEKLPTTNEIDPRLFPKGCAIEQIAIQSRDYYYNDGYGHGFPNYEEGPVVAINKTLWDQISNDQKAALILHEIVYHEAIENVIKSAEPIRYFNSLLFTANALNVISLFDYIKALEGIHGKDLDLLGLQVYLPFLGNVDPKKSAFYPSGKIRVLKVVKDSSFIVLGNIVKIDKDSSIHFYESGDIQKVIAKSSEEDFFNTPIGPIKFDYIYSINEKKEVIKGWINKPAVIDTGSSWSLPCSSRQNIQGRMNYPNIAFEDEYLLNCIVDKDTKIEGPGFSLITKEEGLFTLNKGTPAWEEANPTMSGTIKINDVLVKIASTENGKYGEMFLRTENNYVFKLPGGSVEVSGYFQISNSRTLSYFEPKKDFSYNYLGQNINIAAKTYCLKRGKLLDNWVTFYSNGKLKEFTLYKNRNFDGNEYKKGTVINLNENGNVNRSSSRCTR